MSTSNGNFAKAFDSIPKLEGEENFVAWNQRLTLALLLTKTSSFIKTLTHIDLLTDPSTLLPRSAAIYSALKKLYGTSGAQYSFMLGRKFIGNQCEDGEDVEAWMNKVVAQYRELKVLSFDLDALCICHEGYVDQQRTRIPTH